MSFNVEFVAASADDASKIVVQEHLPENVRSFILHGLTAFPTGLVRVKAVGHLYNNDYKYSTAVVEVNEVLLRAPKPT